MVLSQHRGELQHLVGHGSTCDWCNTWTESLRWFFFFFFPFPERGYMAVCSWNKDRTPPCWHAAWFLNPPLSFSFLGRKIVSSQTWNSSGPHPWPPTLHHVPSIAFFPGVGGWWGGNSFIIALFSLKHEPPLPCFFFFILGLLPFPETLHRNTCRGLNSVHCFQSSLPHLDLRGPCGRVSGCILDSFTVLSFHKCHRDLVMTRGEYMINWKRVI